MDDCWVVGVDEAGRGSLVGEMMVAAIALPRNASESGIEGVRDSKELSPAARARLYRVLSRSFPFSVTPVPPSRIDSENLNKLTAEAAYIAIRVVARSIGGFAKICRITVDKFGDPSLLVVKLRKEGYRREILVTPRADKMFTEVAAASIIAKHVRDSRIRVLRKLYGLRGSGYPSDPRTVAWLWEQIERGFIPPIVRRSWETLRGTPFYKPKPRGSGKRSVTLDDFF